MNRYNALFDSKFRNCPLLATMHDEGRDRVLKLFYLADDPLHVGVFDGVDTWISPVKGCFHGLATGHLESQIIWAAQGKISPEIRERKSLPRRTIFRHRRLTHAQHS